MRRLCTKFSPPQAWLEAAATKSNFPMPLPVRTRQDFLTEFGAEWDEIDFVVRNLLPPTEKHVTLLIWMHGMRQDDVGEILGLSQEMVAYFKKRAVFRIRTWIRHRRIDLQRMEEVIRRWITRKQAEAIMLYMRLHGQHAVGRELGLTQAAVSSRLTRGYRLLRRVVRTPWMTAGERAELRSYVSAVDDLMMSNSLRSVQWKRGGPPEPPRGPIENKPC